MNQQEPYEDEEDGPGVLSSCIREAFGADLGLQKLEEVMNTKAASYTTKIESLIQVWQQVRECRLEDHGDYVVRLMDWLKRHTLNIVLNGDWKAKKNITGQYEEKLLNEINNCELYLANANNIYSLRCRKLAEVIKDPWGNTYLIRILSGTDKSVGPEVFEFFRMETGHLLSTRLKQLCESHCEDLALNLLTVFMECHRLSEVKNFSLNASLNQIRYCYDVYIALLFKFKRYDDIITTLRSMSLVEGLELITRFAKKRVSALKIWKHSKQIAHLVGTEYVREIVSKPPENSIETLETFLEIWLSVTDISTERLVDLFKENIRKIILTAESAVLLYPFCGMLFKKFGKQMKTFVIEFYVRALTTDMNILERERNENETEKATATTERLANGFLCLADVLDEHVKVSRECALTSFSLVPTRISLNKIISLAVRSGCESVDSWKCKYHPPYQPPTDMADELQVLTCKECGESMIEVKRATANINTALCEALTAEEIGLGPQLCDDLVVLLSSPRYQFLNWLVPWSDLYRLCVSYLEDEEGTRNYVKDLKFVEIDYSQLAPMNRDFEDNDAPIYEPYLADYLKWNVRTSDTQDAPSNIDTEIALLPGAYCSKSSPDVVKILRQYRRTTKRTNPTTPPESEPPEKIYLPSSSAASTSQTCGNSCVKCPDKTSDFFSPFYYYVNNYNKRTKLVPLKKKHKTSTSNNNSTCFLPTTISSNMAINDLATGTHMNRTLLNSSTASHTVNHFTPLDYSNASKTANNSILLDYSTTTQTTHHSVPLDYSMTTQTNYSEIFENHVRNFRQNLNINNNISNETGQLTNNSKSLVSENVTSDGVSNVLSENSSIILNPSLEVCSLQKNFKGSVESRDNCSKENLNLPEDEYNSYLTGIKGTDLNSINLCSSDSESIDSEINIVKTETSIRKIGDSSHRKRKFDRETPFHKKDLTSDDHNTDIEHNSQNIISEAERNFHLGGKNTDSPEDKLSSEGELQQITPFSDISTSVHMPEDDCKMNLDSKIATYLNRLKSVTTTTGFNKICKKKADTVEVTDNETDAITVIKNETDCEDYVAPALDFMCNDCKRKLKSISKTSVHNVESNIKLKLLSIIFDCIDNGHIRTNTSISSTIAEMDNLDNAYRENCGHVNQINVLEIDEQEVPLNLIKDSHQSEEPLNLTTRSLTDFEANGVNSYQSLLEFTNHNEPNIINNDNDVNCDIPRHLTVLLESKSSSIHNHDSFNGNSDFENVSNLQSTSNLENVNVVISTSSTENVINLPPTSDSENVHNLSSVSQCENVMLISDSDTEKVDSVLATTDSEKIIVQSLDTENFHSEPATTDSEKVTVQSSNTQNFRSIPATTDSEKITVQSLDTENVRSVPATTNSENVTMQSLDTEHVDTVSATTDSEKVSVQSLDTENVHNSSTLVNNTSLPDSSDFETFNNLPSPLDSQNVNLPSALDIHNVNNTLDVNKLPPTSHSENDINSPPSQLITACYSSTPRQKKRKFTDIKRKYNIRESSVVLHRINDRKARKRKMNLHDACSSCCGPTKKHETSIKTNKSENKVKEKFETRKLIVKIESLPEYFKTSPLQDINPKVFSKSRDVTKDNSPVKQNSRMMIACVVLNRLDCDLNKEDNTTLPLSKVPGLHDLQMIKPSSVDRIVQVVQVPAGRCATNVPVQANMTQISPHIQRIGQPRFEKLDCTNLSDTATTTDTTASTTPTLINLLPQQTSRLNNINNSRLRKNIPALNLMSQTIKPANSSCTFQLTSSGNGSEGQVNNIPRVIASGEQILNQLINPDGTSTQALRTLVGSTGSDQNRIVQLICKAADGKLIPVTSFTSNKVVKLSMTQTVNSQVTGATGSEENVTKFSQTTTKIKAELMENSEILPKFQQAFGKPAYQNCVTECITVNNNECDTSSEVVKSNIRTQSKNANTSINLQPVQGGVIYARQVPVGQSINIIPPARGQILRIATSSTEELSLVKETVIQGKMTALLAAALQGNKQKSLNSNEVSINSEEYSQTSTHLALTACPTLVQNARIVKPIIQIPSNIIRNSPQCNLSSTTLEQLREFDMVYNQVKERSNTGTVTDANPQSETNEEQETQHVSVTYLNQGQKINCAPVVVVSNYCNVQPASSPSLSITSQGSSSPCVTPAPMPIIAKVPVKAKARIIKTPIAQITKISPIPKPQQKPQEDEHTTQRIFDILAEYAEQLRNSPDLNNKPAPRRRSNPPTNPNQSSKRKKSAGSKKIEQSNSTIDLDFDDAHTVGSEDSSCGVIQLSVPDDEQPSVELSENSGIPKQIILTDNVTNQHHNLIITDSSVGEALKVSGTAVLVPGNYIMPVSMMKGSQQIVVSGGNKILATVPARSGSNMLLFQSFLNPGHKPVLSTVKCSAVQPVVELQNVSSTNQMCIDVSTSSQNTTATQVALRTSALMDADSDREVFLNIPDLLENKKVVNDQIRKVYHNNFHHKKLEPKDGISFLEKVLSDTKVESSSVLQEAAAISNGTDTKPIIINCLASTTNNSISQINNSVNTVSTSVATSVITHIKDDMNGIKGSEQKSEIARRIFSSGDFLKDTDIQMEGRIRSVLMSTGAANGFSFPRITSTTCNKQADSTLNKDMCDEGKLKNKKPVIHTYRARSKKIRKGSKLSSKNLPMQGFNKQVVPHKDLQRKQVIIQKDLHLQKSLSEECADLGVDEPSTTELFPEADFMYDSTNQYEQPSLSVRRASQSIESTDVPKEVGLFCDIEPIRTDPFFDSYEYQTQIVEFHHTEEITNGQHYNSNSCDDESIDNTLLQTSLSADEVTIPDPREENTSPSSIFKYECVIRNYKKKESDSKKLTRKNFSDKLSMELDGESTKIVSTNQSLESCGQL